MSTPVKEAQRVSGGEDEHGHLEEFRTDPIALMQRVRDECGDVGYFQLAGKKVDGKDVWEGGKILDPESGKEYSFRMTPIDGGKKLELRAYIGTPMLGRTQTWLRIQ